MKILNTLLLLLFVNFVIAQDIQSKAQIEHITIFKNRAQIASNVTANLKSGISKIIISDLASTIDNNTIQVGGRGDFVLLAVNFEKDFISKKVMMLQDSLEMIAANIDQLDMQLDVNKQETEMIMDNTKIKSDTDDLLSSDLEEMSLYFKKKLTELGTQKLTLKRQKKALELQKSSIENQLKTDPSRNLPLGKIILTVKANNPTTARLNLKYLVYGTGWNPNYDIRVANTESPVNIKYKAEVYQNTGVSWDNVKLSLSTAQVNRSSVKPEIYPQYLNFFENRPPVAVRAGAQMKTALSMEQPMQEGESMDMVTAANYAEVVENQLNAQFDISLPYTIKSGKTETVEMQDLNLEAKYTTYVVPKYDENGFLIAEIKDWEKYKLLPASANVYFEDTFVGQSYIQQAGVEDILKISLGRDERIQVKREEIKDYKSTRTFGSNVRQSLGYEITIKNAKKEAVNVVVEDQLPVSQNSEIEVETEELSGGLIEAKTGKIKWEVLIPAAQSKKILLKYTVKYPKDKRVTNL